MLHLAGSCSQLSRAGAAESVNPLHKRDTAVACQAAVFSQGSSRFERAERLCASHFALCVSAILLMSLVFDT